MFAVPYFAGVHGKVVFAAPTAKEKPYSISLKGNSSIPEKDLLKAAAVELQTFEQRGYRKADIDDAAFQMRNAYLQAGFAFVAVDYTHADKGNIIQVDFNIQEGPRVTVSELKFNGNRALPPEKLLGIFWNNVKITDQQSNRVFIESQVKEGLNRIREFYRREGYVDAAIGLPNLTFAEDRSEVAIVTVIAEGPQYIIRDVNLEGDLIAGLAPEFDKIKSGFLGKPYYVRQKLLLRTRLEDAYDAIGYAEANIEIKVVWDKDSGQTTMSAAIESGRQIRISEIVISGNAGTKESFIRDRLQFKPGDIYSRKKRTESFRKLYDSGLFAKIDMELIESGEEEGRVLKVTIEELPSREYYLEPGWGSYERLRLRAGAFEKNLFGTGRNSRIEGLISTKSESITVSYTDPWLLHTDITMNIPVYYENRDEPSYTSQETGFAVLLYKKLSANLTLSTSYRYKMTQLLDLNTGTPLQRREDDYNQGTLGVQAVWDSRDALFFPAAGMRVSVGSEISLPAIGSDIEFGRLTFGGRYFYRLPGDYIIGLRYTTGLIIPINDQFFIPISERFFNGGDNTVRSYEHSELGPKDSDNEPLGGLAYNVFSVELRKRILKNFAATLYVDAGNVSPNNSLLERGLLPYTDRSELFDDTMTDFFSEFKFGVGIGLQYLLPVGPVRFDLAYNPDPEERWREDSWAWHFSLGMAF